MLKKWFTRFVVGLAFSGMCLPSAQAQGLVIRKETTLVATSSAGAWLSAAGAARIHSFVGGKAHLHVSMSAFAQSGTSFSVVGTTAFGSRAVLGAVVLNDFGEGELILESGTFVSASTSLAITAASFGCAALIPPPVIAFADIQAISVLDAWGNVILAGNL